MVSSGVALTSPSALMQIWGVFLSVAACAFFAPDLAEMVGGAARGLLFSGGTPLPSDLSVGKHRERNGDWEGAVKAYRQYAAEDPEDIRPLIHIALIYHHKMEKKDVALYWYDKALSFPGYQGIQALAFFEKAKILRDREDLDGLKGLYHDMIPGFPAHPSTVAVQEFIKSLESPDRIS